MDIFAQGTRLGVRFETAQGMLSIEDVWHLPKKSKGGASLDTLSRTLYRELKASEEEVSFVTPTVPNTRNDVLQLKFDIVKSIIDVRLAEEEVIFGNEHQNNKEARQQKEKSEKRQRIMALMERRQNEADEGLSMEELRQMLEQLG